MKKCVLLFTILFGLLISTTGSAANLMEVYQQALMSDQVFQQALSQRLITRQGLPISISAVLPALSATVNPYITKTSVSGATNFIGSNTVRGYTFNLALTQTVFNFAQFANIGVNCSLSKQADATLNAALQSLMLRVAKAYFAILQDEDTIRNGVATKEAYAKQLDQITQQYKVGLKTITDVYTAQASYDGAVAGLIAARNNLSNDRENLRVITGVYYPSIAKLGESFPFVTPKPANIELWVERAQIQNWQIKAAQYGADAARTNIKQQFAGHLPT
jgi:outer membrane protein